MFPTLRRSGLVLVFTLSVAACAARTEIELPDNQPGRVTVLEVLNRATLDMSIFVLPESGGSRQRLGTATALTTSHFTIPERMLTGVSGLRFQADPVGSSRIHHSEQITVVPGDTVMLQIPPS
jgi:hypothetical protein